MFAARFAYNFGVLFAYYMDTNQAGCSYCKCVLNVKLLWLSLVKPA